MKTRAILMLLLSVGLTAALWSTERVPAKRVALVFDDGPRPADAEALLAVLAKEQVHVTFALVGDRVKKVPATAKIIAEAGHEIVNHSQTHSHPSDLGDAALDHEVTAPQEKIRAAIGIAPRWYWPPFIQIDNRLLAAAAKAGLTVYPIRHLVVSLDYEVSTPPAAEIYRRATTDVQDGSVILFHEWRKETREQLPAILAELRRQGCVFLTFSALNEALTAKVSDSRKIPAPWVDAIRLTQATGVAPGCMTVSN